MNFEQMTPFLRFIGLGTTAAPYYEEMMGYECRMFYIVEGSGILEINKTPYTLNRGDLVIINSGISYRIRFPQWKVNYYMVKFDCTQEYAHITADNAGAKPCDFDRARIRSHMDFEDAPQFSEYCILSNMTQAEKLLHLIFKEERKRLIGWRMIANGLLMEILTHCLRAGTGYSDTSRLKDVLDFLHASYDTNISNAEISARFGYHPNYLSSLFQKIAGKSLHQYLISVRLSHAAEMLENSKLPVAQVAAKCGFENSAKFSAMFKKTFGVTPSQFRKNSRLQ